MYYQNDSLTPSQLPLPAGDPALLEALMQPRIALFWGASTPTRALLAMLTALAVQGQALRVFDGGNRFDGYFVARLARRMCKHPYVALERIRLSRAFTCFQLAERIEKTPVGPEPVFVLDLLTTFYDENVPLRDSERLLETTISHLKRLATVSPVIVGAREPRELVKERWAFLDQLQIAADIAWLLRAPEAALERQPRLL
jgi:hypothetical protein